MSLRPTASGTKDDLARWIREASIEVNRKLEWVGVPASVNSPGKAGQIAYEPGFVYFAVAQDIWARVAIAAWPEAVIGHELIPNGGFGVAAGHTLTNMAISGGQLTAAGAGFVQTDEVSALEFLVAGTYRFEIDIVATDAGDSVYAKVAGTEDEVPSSHTTGAKTVDIVVASVADQIIRISAPDTAITIDNWHCERIA